MSRPRDEDKNVLVRFDHELHETPKAYKVAMSEDDDEGIWMPKSQVASYDSDSGEIWVSQWIAETKGLEYE